MKRHAALVLWLAAALAHADWPGLPPDAAVSRVLAGRPEALAAQAELAAGAARRERLLSGPYEWNLRLTGQQRRSAPPDGERQRFGEWGSALERSVRLPGKAGLDGELGEATLARANSAFGDSQHEARRELLQLWFGWRAESAALAQSEVALASLARQRVALGRRLALGDASRLEYIQAQAAHAQAAAQHALLGAEVARQRELLLRRYPGLPLDDGALPEPPAPEGDEANRVARLVDRSHLLALAERENRLAELAAQRQRAERLPDPALGVAFSRERGGEEQVVAAYVSIPLPGAARRASEREAAAGAEVARQRLLAVRREVELAAINQVRSAVSVRQAWQAAAAAAADLLSVANLAERAYALGEGTLAEALLARRQASEAAQLAARLQADALHLGYRVLLDGEVLWADAVAEAGIIGP